MTTDSPFPNDEAPEEQLDAASERDGIDETFADDDGVLYDDQVTPEYGILGFTLRELLIVGVWLVSFVLSFFPIIGELSLWAFGIEWVLPIGVPTAAVFLLVLRRFSPDGIRRVGSLGIDQFASVAFSVSAVLWVSTLWLAIARAVEFGHWDLPWYGIVQVIASLALVALTVFSPLIPGLKEDFHGRLVTLAHRNANPVRPVIPRPQPEPTHADRPADDRSHADAAYADDAAHADAGAESDGVAQAEAVAYAPPVAPTGNGLDAELSDAHTTDEVARFDVAGRVPLSAHASGGGTGTAETTSTEDYVPAYSRRSRSEEIVSDTASIEALVMPEDDTDVFAPERPADSAGAGAESAHDAPARQAPAQTAPADPTQSYAASAHQSAAQPFWILAPTERDVHDEQGRPLFRIGPTAWALVIEDRGGAYVVRHDDGRIGYLHDIADVSKG